MDGKLIHVLWTLRYCQQPPLISTDRTYPWLNPDSNKLGFILEGLSLEYCKLKHFVGKCQFITFSKW